MTPLRTCYGLLLPELPGTRQTVLELEPSASLPPGFRLAEEPAGLQLIRESDGERLGIMSSVEVAARHAGACVRREGRS